MNETTRGWLLRIAKGLSVAEVLPPPAPDARRREPRGDAGAWLVRVARAERRSVDVFVALARDLTEHAAPPALARAALLAASDERRHARAVARLARARGAAVARVDGRAAQRCRSIDELAIDNVALGCVREAYDALVAAHQAERAEHDDVRRAMRRIARDEAGHALLADAIDRWARDHVDRRDLEAARADAIATLRREVLDAELDDATSRALGLPDRAQRASWLDALG